MSAIETTRLSTTDFRRPPALAGLLKSLRLWRFFQQPSLPRDERLLRDIGVEGLQVGREVDALAEGGLSAEAFLGRVRRACGQAAQSR